MILFHTTDSADAILSGGFRDGTGSIVAEGEGVFLSEKPLMNAHEGATGDQLLQLDFSLDPPTDLGGWCRVSLIGVAGVEA